MSRRGKSRYANGGGGNVIRVWFAVLALALFFYGLPEKFNTRVAGMVKSSFFWPFIYVNEQYQVLRNNLEQTILLRKELTKARIELDDLREARVENIRLKKMLEMEENSEHTLLMCQVVGSDAKLYPGTVLVNQGRNAGVRANMPVISTHGLVGKVRNVNSNTAVIQLLRDPRLKIAAKNQRSRVMGIMQSHDSRRLSMEQVKKSEDFSEGDRIITSGMGGIFPRGLLVGHVIEVVEPPEGMFMEILVQPSAKLDKLEEVFVMIEVAPDSIENDEEIVKK